MNDLPHPDTKSPLQAREETAAAGIVTTARITGQRLPPAGDTFLGRRVTPLTRRRVENFKANRRGFWSLWLFLALFAATLCAEFIANDRPLLIRYEGAFYT